MKVILEQEDIVAALTTYLDVQGLNINAMDVSVDLVAGRGGNGHRAEIDLTPRPNLEVHEGESTLEIPPGTQMNTLDVDSDPEPEPEEDPAAKEGPAKGESLFQ